MARPKKVKGNTFSVTLGGYGHEAAAKAAAAEFMHPNVFSYQSALFPSPTSFGIEAVVAKAAAVKLENKHPLYQWGVTMQLNLTGPEENCKKWEASFRGRIRVKSV